MMGTELLLSALQAVAEHAGPVAEAAGTAVPAGAHGPDEAMSWGSVATRLAVVFALVLLNAFFVAAEFALVGARRSKVDEMVMRGERGARSIQKALTHLDRYLSATQLGITLASLGLGWLGEPALAVLVDRGLSAIGIDAPPGAVHSVAAVATAFGIITFLHIVLGELAPKSLALISPEKVSAVVAQPLMLFTKLMTPFIWVLNGAATRLLRLFGVQPAVEGHRVHSPEEIRLLVMQARAHGTLDESDSAMLAGVFDFHHKKAHDVMRPRTDVVAIHEDASEAEVWALVRAERFSRYPVYRDTLDDVVGVFLAKDLWLHPADKPFSLRGMVREPLYVPDSRPAERVLDDLRRTRAHMVVVLDEYGGTAGIITMEDLVEEVIGDIADEYDAITRASIEVDGVLELAGSMSLIDVRSDHHVPIPDGDWTTLGGFAFARLGRLPAIGDQVPFPGGNLEVVAMDRRRVAALRVHRGAAPRSTNGGAPPATVGKQQRAPNEARADA